MGKLLKYREECLFSRVWCDNKNEQCKAIKYIYESDSDHFNEERAIWLVENCEHRGPPTKAYKMN